MAPQDVLDWLLANREDSLTPAQIQKRFGYECSEGTQLHKNLLANSKIGVSADGAFTYKVCVRGKLVPPVRDNLQTVRKTLAADTVYHSPLD